MKRTECPALAGDGRSTACLRPVPGRPKVSSRTGTLHPAMGDRVPGGVLPPHTRPPPCIAFFCVFLVSSGAFLPLPPRSLSLSTFLNPSHHHQHQFRYCCRRRQLHVPFFGPFTDTVTPFGSITLLTARSFHALFSASSSPNRGQSSTRVCPRIIVHRIFARALYALRSAGAADRFN